MARRKPVEAPQAVDEAEVRWRLRAYSRLLAGPSATDPPAPNRFAAVLGEWSAIATEQLPIAEHFVAVEAMLDRHGLLERCRRHADTLAVARSRWAR